MKYRCYIHTQLFSDAFTEIGRIKPWYEVVLKAFSLQAQSEQSNCKRISVPMHD